MWKKYPSVIQHLIKWPPEELADFQNYLRLFHPLKRIYPRYIQSILKEKHKLQNPEYPINKLYNKLLSGSAQHTLQNNLSILRRLKKDYIVFQVYGPHTNYWQRELALMRYRLQKGLDLNKVMKTRAEITFDQDVPGVESYIFQYQFFYQLIYNSHLFQIDKHHNRLRSQLQQSLSLMHYLNYLELSLESLILDVQILNTKPSPNSSISLKISYEYLPLVKAYHLLIRAYEKGVPDLAYEAKDFVIEQITKFDPAQQNVFLIKLKNIFTFHQRKGRIDAKDLAKCSLELTQVRLDYNLMSFDGVLTPIGFDNIVGSAIKIEEWKWLDNNLPKMQHLLPHGIKEKVLNLSSAKIAFYRDKNFDHVLQLLPDERKQFQIFHFDIQVRGLRIASYVEKNKTADFDDKVDHLINATQAKLQFEKDRLGQGQMKLFHNFLKMAKYIGLDKKSKKELFKLYQKHKRCLLANWVADNCT